MNLNLVFAALALTLTYTTGVGLAAAVQERADPPICTKPSNAAETALPLCP
ncbi:hypothetical protein PM082_020992 [Marasmius tenuissimus]|nr:hypothetical protein PM082_020992 [Marasmius tenuissimus]